MLRTLAKPSTRTATQNTVVYDSYVGVDRAVNPLPLHLSRPTEEHTSVGIYKTSLSNQGAVYVCHPEGGTYVDMYMDCTLSVAGLAIR